MCDGNNETNLTALTEINPVINCEADPVTYEIGKRVFVVTPAYRKNTDKTIYDSLTNLMIKDTDNN